MIFEVDIIPSYTNLRVDVLSLGFMYIIGKTDVYLGGDPVVQIKLHHTDLGDPNMTRSVH